ncbi:unnamed protein product [Aphis gossypii]|uniref:Glucose-methanol-choline oxidoreductase N-terminal domain-containing protein n=1 Tax=Aphis gossypii TaxID=80765 RepID=A0A9P0NMX2_APHGO|nr:unnamed protein product [Aphis gossypii]
MSDPEPMGFSIAQLMMSSAKTRVTTPTAYLRPHLRTRSNLRVRINSHVTRLLVDADRRSVYGVEYVDGSNRTRRLTARKEVILCAGVIGSAHLLMLSGIGPAEDLRPLGVPVVQDLRVGHNLQHHVGSKLTFQLNVTNDQLLSFDAIGQYMKHRSGRCPRPAPCRRPRSCGRTGLDPRNRPTCNCSSTVTRRTAITPNRGTAASAPRLRPRQ